MRQAVSAFSYQRGLTKRTRSKKEKRKSPAVSDCGRPHSSQPYCDERVCSRGCPHLDFEMRVCRTGGSPTNDAECLQSLAMRRIFLCFSRLREVQESNWQGRSGRESRGSQRRYRPASSGALFGLPWPVRDCGAFVLEVSIDYIDNVRLVLFCRYHYFREIA